MNLSSYAFRLINLTFFFLGGLKKVVKSFDNFQVFLQLQNVRIVFHNKT